MKTLTATEAARGFKAMLDDVAHGERVTITRAGHPVATLIPATSTRLVDVIDVVAAVGPIDDAFGGDIADALTHLDMAAPDRWDAR